MFKRVEKRRIRKQERVSMGEIDDMLALDTDSEESVSDSSENDLDSLESEGEDLENVDEDDDEMPTLTVREALNDPIHIVSLDPDIRLCAICPGKLLKSVEMVAIHRKSDAHQRRFRKFQSNSSAYDPNARVSEVLPSVNQDSTGMSKRAQKRKARKDFIMAKRERSKIAKAAKKGAQDLQTNLTGNGLTSQKTPPINELKSEPTNEPTVPSPKTAKKKRSLPSNKIDKQENSKRQKNMAGQATRKDKADSAKRKSKLKEAKGPASREQK